MTGKLTHNVKYWSLEIVCVLSIIVVLVLGKMVYLKERNEKHPQPNKPSIHVYQSEPYILKCEPRLDIRIVKIYAEPIDRYSKEHKIPYKIVCKLINTESSWYQLATSERGAQGPTQLMPKTAQQLGVTDPYDINQSIWGGTKHLRYLLDKYKGNYRSALAAYNMGETKYDLYIKEGRKLPKETRDFVKAIMKKDVDYRFAMN